MLEVLAPAQAPGFVLVRCVACLAMDVREVSKLREQKERGRLPRCIGCGRTRCKAGAAGG